MCRLHCAMRGRLVTAGMCYKRHQPATGCISKCSCVLSQAAFILLYSLSCRSSSTTAAAAATTPSRHLLQSDSGSTGVVAGDQLSLWQGYQLDVAGRARNWAVDETGAPEQARYVGAAPGRNKVVAGLFLHTTRKARTASCTGVCWLSLARQLVLSRRDILMPEAHFVCGAAPDTLANSITHAASTAAALPAGSSFEAKFDFGCQKSAVPLARNASVVRSYLSSLFAGDDNEVFPYGVDPAFLRSSEALYKPELQGAEGRYYNTSDPTQVPPTTGAPYGFFHRRLQVRAVDVCCMSCTFLCVCDASNCCQRLTPRQKHNIVHVTPPAAVLWMLPCFGCVPTGLRVWLPSAAAQPAEPDALSSCAAVPAGRQLP